MRKLALALLCLTACGGSQAGTDGKFLAGFHPADPPTNGFQLAMAPHTLPAGSSEEWCHWTDYITDGVLDVRSVAGFESKFGHHIVLYTTNVMQPPGTLRVCTDADMTTFRFVAATSFDGTEATPPGDLVFRIPKGVQLVVNEHYINATAHDAEVQAAVNVGLADPGQSYVPAGNLAFTNTSMELKPGAQALDIRCAVQKDVPVWSLQPHMHTLGTRFLLERTPDGGATDALPETLIDVTNWQAEYEFHPPETFYDLASPLMLHAGDQIHVRCEWQNDTSKTLYFGDEMCVAFAQTVNGDDSGNLLCDDGNWGDF